MAIIFLLICKVLMLVFNPITCLMYGICIDTSLKCVLGFKKDKVKLEVNTTTGHITVTGETQVNANEFKYFEENFTIPANSDVDKITGQFDGEILYVTVPKVVAVVQEKKEPEIVQEKKEAEIVQEKKEAEIEQNQNIEGAAAAENTHLRAPNNNDGKYTHKDDGKNDAESNKLLGNARIFFSPENIRKWEDDNGILRSAMEVLNKNKGIVITAIVAFSLGMLVTRKFETGP